jgi:hypothetical protein
VGCRGSHPAAAGIALAFQQPPRLCPAVHASNPRATLSALVVMDVHARDVAAGLAAEEGVAGQPGAFSWTSQLRQYWEPSAGMQAGGGWESRVRPAGGVCPQSGIIRPVSLHPVMFCPILAWFDLLLSGTRPAVFMQAAAGRTASAASCCG